MLMNCIHLRSDSYVCVIYQSQGNPSGSGSFRENGVQRRVSVL